MPSLLGIDNGLTVTKAVVFDADGRQLAVARRRVPQSIPRPHHVERDMDGLWAATAEAIREALAASGRPAADIAAVAATAHGDGIYLLDADRRPLGPAILSLDSRAGAIAEAWTGGPVADAALALTGQLPHASAPSALLAWIRDHEPDRYARIATAFACKDWLRFCLTGAVGTDRTEASTSFTDVRTQAWSPEALRLFGLDALAHALPPIARSAEIAGHVTPEAAALTGLLAGTPVAAGLHDVTASALGIGGHAEGVLAIVAGTYSINETVSTEPLHRPALVLPQRHRARPLERHGDLARLRRQLRLVPRHPLPRRARRPPAPRSTPSSPPRSTPPWRNPRPRSSTPTSSARRTARPPAPASSACAPGTTAARCCAPSSKASPSTTASTSTRCATASPSARPA